jgi:hypothetical protein
LFRNVIANGVVIHVILNEVFFCDSKKIRSEESL